MQISSISFKGLKKEDYNKYGTTNCITSVCGERAKLERDAIQKGKQDVAVFVDPEEFRNGVKCAIFCIADGKEGRTIKHLVQAIDQNKGDLETVKILRTALYRIQKHFISIAK